MRHKVLLFILAFGLAACQNSGQQSSSTEPASSPTAPPPSATPLPAATATPIPPPADTDTPQPPTETAAPNLAGPSILLTTQALAGMAQLPTRTPVPENQPTPANEFVPIFNQAWGLVHENYVRGDFNGLDWDAIYDEYLPQVEAVTDQEAFWGVMGRLIGELDDKHSRFVPPSRFAAEFDIPRLSQGEGRPSLGAIIWPAREDEYLFVWDVCQISPAADAGIKRGDIITAINGQPVEPGEEGYDRGDVFGQIYSQEDGVTLTIHQGADQEPQDLEISFGGVGGCPGWIRGIISESPRIGYIAIPDFGGGSDTVLLGFVNELEEDAPLDGLILDVRHNPGGNSDADAAIFTEGTFGTTGKLREGASQVIVRIRGPVKWNATTPMALLIDGSSHSAAEYFATFLQQSERAVLVGAPTAGNTEGITGFTLSDGSLIRLAVQIITLPDGSSIEDVGVQPDIPVPLGQWGLGEDIQLQAALQAVIDQIR